jgi:nicotinamidase-related amidase
MQQRGIMKTALLLVDIQNDYFPCGKMVLEGSFEASERAKRVLSAFRENGLPLIHIQHVSTRPGATFFLPGTDGAEIHPNVKPLAGELVIEKHYPNSFRDTTLMEQLRTGGITHLAICGMMTHMCIDATTRAAFDHGFQCTVLSDACATRDLALGGDTVSAGQVHTAFLAALSQIYAKIVCTDDFIGAAGHR